MVRPAFASQAALRRVLVLRPEQDQVLRHVPGLLVLEQLDARDRGADGVDIHDHQVGAHADRLHLGRGRRGGDRSRLGLGARGRCGHPCVGSPRRLARHCARSGRRRRLRALLLLPGVPQQQQREAEDEEQD